MGLTCLPGEANFLVVLDPPLGATALTEALLCYGIIVRPMGDFGLPNALRVTIGLPEQNHRFLTAIRVALSDALIPQL